MTSFDLRKRWNDASAKIPLNKDTPNYTIEVECQIPRNSIICDLGGSTGVSANYFVAHGHEVTLLDISDNGLSVATEQASIAGHKDNLETIQYDFSAGKFPLPDNKFDVVYSRLSLHYFTSKRLAELFQEIYRVLKPSGKAYITVKSPDDLAEMKYLKDTTTEVEDGVFDEGGMLKTRFSKDKYAEILGNSGVMNFTISDYIETYAGKKDVVKSGNTEMKLIEIKIAK